MNIKYCIITLCVGIIIGFVLGRMKPKNMDLYEFLRKIYINLDNFILIFSFSIVIGSIYFSANGKLERFASVAINIFGSVVFSWLLTKKSSKAEFKENEEELALRSFRHLNYIESAANTAHKKIEKYMDSQKELDESTRLILGATMDQIEYIQRGISTCKMDWHDMLSKEKKEYYKNSCDDGNTIDEEYGTVNVNMAETEYNQEDA